MICGDLVDRRSRFRQFADHYINRTAHHAHHTVTTVAVVIQYIYLLRSQLAFASAHLPQQGTEKGVNREWLLVCLCMQYSYADTVQHCSFFHYHVEWGNHIELLILMFVAGSYSLQQWTTDCIFRQAVLLNPTDGGGYVACGCVADFYLARNAWELLPARMVHRFAPCAAISLKLIWK